MNDTPPRIHRGGCLCGAVRYEVEGSPMVVAHCHCVSCQRGSGAGHATGAMFPAEKLRLVGAVTEYKNKSDKGNEVTRAFCSTCGSPMLGSNSGMVGFVTITLGTLDDLSGFEPKVAVFARNKKPWDRVDESVLSFDGQPDWKPKSGV